MSTALEKVTEHFKNKVAGGMGSYTAAEWGFTVYWRPMTARELGLINKAREKSLGAGVIEHLILRSRDEDGELLFKPSDRNELNRKSDIDVVLLVVAAMDESSDQDDESVSVDEAEKNSGKTKT